MLFGNIKPYVAPSIASHLEIGLYPFLISPCIPGIRCYIKDGEIKGYLGQSIKNTYINQYVRENMPLTDGVLECVITLDKLSSLKKIKEVVNSESHPEQETIIFQVHDLIVDVKEAYNKRMEKMINFVMKVSKDKVAFVPQRLIYGLMQLKQYEQACVLGGYQGVIMRKYDGEVPEGADSVSIVYKPLTMV